MVGGKRGLPKWYPNETKGAWAGWAWAPGLWGCILSFTKANCHSNELEKCGRGGWRTLIPAIHPPGTLPSAGKKPG